MIPPIAPDNENIPPNANTAIRLATAVASRIAVLAFGGIFSLSGAIGGIIGQNFGAERMNRVKQTYRDALVFCVIYTLVSWGILVLFRESVATLFGLVGLSREVLLAFMLIGAGGYMFAGALFVSNAAAFDTNNAPANM